MDTKLAAWSGGPEREARSPATFCVLGAAGGGLSLATTLLATLGVPFGDRPPGCDDDHELDVEANSALDFGDPGAHRRSVLSVGALADAVNAELDVWGWCDPMASHYIGELLPRLRFPRLVAIFRDPYLVARRRAVELGLDPLDAHEEVLSIYERIRRVVADGRWPYLLIGSDKAVARPAECVAALAEFVGLETDEASRRSALDLLRSRAPSAAVEGLDPSVVRRALDGVPA